MSDAAVSDSFEQVREMSLMVDEGSICLRLDGERVLLDGTPLTSPIQRREADLLTPAGA